MRRKIRKIVLMMVVVAMVFVSVAVSGCGGDNSDCIVEYRFKGLKQEFYVLQHSMENDCEIEYAVLLIRIEKLIRDLNELKNEIKECKVEMLSEIKIFRKSIQEFRIIITNRIDKGYSECRNFFLSISVDNRELEEGENFVIRAALTNLSETDVLIARYFLFYPQIEGENWIFQRVPPPWPVFEIFEANTTIEREIHLINYFELSQNNYKLQVGAMFFLDWEKPEDPNSITIPWDVPDVARKIMITSNLIELIVL